MERGKRRTKERGEGREVKGGMGKGGEEKGGKVGG